MDLVTRTVGDVAATLPGATAVFRRHGIDFCCGGAVPLDRAARAKGIDPAALAAELATLESGAAPAPRRPDLLIPYILARYHEGHRAALPELVRLARKVEAVHAAKPLCPAGLADALAETGATLEDHMHKEEAVLFPLMLRGGAPGLFAPIACMTAEHDEHGRRLRRLEALAHGCVPPVDACGTWRALYAGLARFIAEVEEHVHLENNVLFPQFAETSQRATDTP
jgi:regulator of cell morphogenesis and NO signaling